MLKFLKKHRFYIITLIVAIVVLNLHVPYYVVAPGGTIDIGSRIKIDDEEKINGSLNLLYVSEYDGTVATLLVGFIMPNWDIHEIEDIQVADEDYNDIYERNRIMLDNANDNAIYVAYTKAGKEIEVTDRKTVVLVTTSSHDGSLKVGDEILKADGIEIENVNQLKEIIRSKETGDNIKLEIIRDDETMNVSTTIKEDNGQKVIGAVIITDYDYEFSPSIQLEFKSSESGSSGGLMTAIGIYDALVSEDIVNGRKIAGTGTIEVDGTVGEIDGIKYKIMGAHKNKVDLVLVPVANYEEAMKVNDEYNYGLKIVSVKTFDDAIAYLTTN